MVEWFEKSSWIWFIGVYSLNDLLTPHTSLARSSLRAPLRYEAFVSCGLSRYTRMTRRRRRSFLMRLSSFRNPPTLLRLHLLAAGLPSNMFPCQVFTRPHNIYIGAIQQVIHLLFPNFLTSQSHSEPLAL